MEKNEYNLESFKNIQELIRFTDQKVAAILVLLGLELTIFFDYFKDYVIPYSGISIRNALMFIFCFSFFYSVVCSIYIALIKILKPSFAKHYSPDIYSSFYFEHIANHDKNRLIGKLSNMNKEDYKKEIIEQIYEISKVLKRKNEYCVVLIWITFFSIVCLGIVILITKI